MKKIGFVDYYISEWHANNYPGWIKAACDKLGLDFVLSYAWAERDISPLDGRSTDEWCNAFGVEKCATVDQLCERADFIIVLAPSNPEKHLSYAESVLKYGKPTYIDKTFAPDHATAKKIFELGEKYSAPFFSSSALRYADEIKDVSSTATSVDVKGGGSAPEEYIIHQIEMLVKCIGIGSNGVSVSKENGAITAVVSYPDERRATLFFSEAQDFEITVKDGMKEFVTAISSPFFNNLIEDILRFFDTKKTSFDTRETLEVMKIREEFIKAL